VKDPFYGIRIGDVVHVENGPRFYKGHNALVIARELVEEPSEEMIKEPEPNITVICREETVQLWPGWVKKLEVD